MQPATDVSNRCSSRLRGMMTAKNWLLLLQFARFGTVGVAGAIVDVTTVYAWIFSATVSLRKIEASCGK